MKIEELFKNFDFNDKTEYEISELNGVQFPRDYLDFMHRHNGGEGDVGENTYVSLFMLEELEEINSGYGIAEYLPDYFIVGTDGGGMLLGYSSAKNLYFAVDAMNISDEETFYEADSLVEFFERMDEELG